MKSVRPPLLVFGAIVLVASGLLALARMPAVQRYFILRHTKSVPGLSLQLTRVSVGFSDLAVSGLELEKNGVKVRLDNLETDYSLWQLLFRRRLVIHRLTATGLLVDASLKSRTAAPVVVAGGPAVTPGVLAQVELPIQVVLEDCTIRGRALLPGAGGQLPIEAQYEIAGGHFSPGQEGSLLLTATLKNAEAGAHVGALHAQVSLRAMQNSARSLSRVTLTAVVDAEGLNISDQNQLKISGELNHENQDETYAVNIDTLIHGTAEKLLAVHATLPAGKTEFSGDWNLKARTAQLEPFFLGAAFPDFTAHGEGRFAFAPSTGAVSLQGNLAADASRLEAIKPAWRVFGAVKLQAQFDVSEAEQVARLRLLDIQLNGAQPVLTAHAAQAAEFNLKDRRLQIAGPVPADVLNLKLQGLPVSWVQPFVPGLEISGGFITGNITVAAEKERLLIKTAEPLRVDELTLANAGTVLFSTAEVRAAAEIAIDQQQVAITVDELGLKTPAGDALTVHGSVIVPGQPHAAVAVKAAYTADLPKLLAPWLPSGRIKLTGDTDFSLAGGNVELNGFNTTATDGDGKAMAKASSLHPFGLDLTSGRIVGGNAVAVDLARISLEGLPLNCLPLAQQGAVLGGSVEQGDFLLSTSGNKLTLRAVSAMKLAGVSLTQNGQPALTGLAIEAHPMVEFTDGNSFNAQSGEVSVRSATGVSLLAFKGDLTSTPSAGLRSTVNFSVEVPALASQPLFAGTEAVSDGRASGELRAALGRDSQVEARITVNGLVARESGQLLPVANLSFRGAMAQNGHVSIQAPLLLDRAGQRSDLNCAFELTPAGKNFLIEGKVTGEHIELADALAVFGVFSPSVAGAEKPAGPSAAPAPVVADPVSAWSRYKGQVALDLKSATAGKEWSMTGLSGLVTIEPAQLSLQKLEASFGEKSRLAAKAELKFVPATQPYQLAGDFSLTEFDVGRLFKALDPAKPPTIEGTFTVNGQFSGSGETIDRTVGRTYGKFELTSRQGIFRGLQRTSNKVSMTSKAVELGASVLGSILGTDKATRAAEKVAGLSYFVDQLAQSVGEFNYDQFSMKLSREESLNVTLDDISLISPEIRLIGKGEVTYVAGKPLLDQPLAASLALAGRGKMEQLLGKVRALDGTRDELGYARAKEPVAIAGTLAKPDPNTFFIKMAASKLGDLMNSDN